MAESLPAVTGTQLIRLFRRDGWQEGRRTREGIFFLMRWPDGRVSTTVIPVKNRALTSGTLAAILGPRQSGIGREGLVAMIQRHGLK